MQCFLRSEYTSIRHIYVLHVHNLLPSKLSCLETRWVQSRPRTERERVADLVATLTALPFCDAVHTVTPTADETAIPTPEDAVVHCMWAGTSRRTLTAHPARTSIPATAREIIWRMDALIANHPGAVPVLVADAISATAKDLLRARRAAYYDAGGSLFLCNRASLRPHRPARAAPDGKSRPEPGSGAAAPKSSTASCSHQAPGSAPLDSPSRRASLPHRLRRPPQPRAARMGPDPRSGTDQATASCRRRAPARRLGPKQRIRPLVLRQGLLRPRRPRADARARTTSRFRDPRGRLRPHRRVGRAAPCPVPVERHPHPLPWSPRRTVASIRCSATSTQGASTKAPTSPSPGPRSPAPLHRVSESTASGSPVPVIVYLDLLRAGGRGREMARHLRRERLGY